MAMVGSVHTDTPPLGGRRLHAQLHEQELDNGLRVVVEPSQTARSVAMRVFLPCGVIHEPSDARGVASVCAELLLRGSSSLDSRAQADRFDLAGANRESAASPMGCAASVVTLDTNAHDAMALLADMVLDPAMRDESFEAARALALQSLASLDDEPSERCVLGARERHLPDPYARNEYGTREGLGALTPKGARDWWGAYAGARGAVLAVSGAVDADGCALWARECFGSWGGAASQPRIGAPAPRGYGHIEQDTNQCQIVIVHDAPSAGHDDNALEMIANAVLSGGMSARLFTEVREKRGLCYSVSSAYRAARDFGVVTAHAGTTPERAQETLDVLDAELRRLNEGGVTRDEFGRALIGLKSRIVFSGESTPARAATMVNDIVHRDAPRTLAQITRRLESVTLDELNAYLARRDLGVTTVQTLGPAPLNPPA